jgi:hypothetical protein
LNTKAKLRRPLSLLAVCAMVGALLITFAAPASAAGETIVPAQSSNLLDGQHLNVTISVPVTITGAFAAVTQCGNANTAGVAYTALTVPTDGSNCAGAEAIGTSLVFVGFPTGPVPAGPSTVSILLEKTHIGTALAQCVASPPAALPCTLNGATATAAGQYTGPGSFSISTPITYKPPVSASISSVTGQTGTSAARSGNTLNLTGATWDASVAPAASLCTTAGTACDAAGLTGALSTDAGGALSGALTVTATATTGARALKIVNPSDSQTVLLPITILGARTISLSPASGGAGTLVTITGSGFNASAPVIAVETDGSPVPLSFGSATVDASGNVTGSLSITSSHVIGIAVSELSNPAVLNAFAPFAYSADSCSTVTPDSNAATRPAGDCQLLQTVHLSVTGGPNGLTFSQGSHDITMSPIVLNGDQQTSTGAIKNVTVLDARGSLVGWTVIATMTDLTDSPTPALHHSIPASNMSWTPACALNTPTSGAISDITTGAPAALSNTVAATLCTAVPGGGGGTFVGSSPLSLIVPASIAAASYSSVITFTVT